MKMPIILALALLCLPALSSAMDRGDVPLSPHQLWMQHLDAYNKNGQPFMGGLQLTAELAWIHKYSVASLWLVPAAGITIFGYLLGNNVAGAAISSPMSCCLMPFIYECETNGFQTACNKTKKIILSIMKHCMP